MKIEEVSKDTTTVEAKLVKIQQFTTSKNGRVTNIIVLCTDKGNFSNFKSVWSKQMIDIDRLQPEACMSIDYRIHTAANGVQFKNFVKVRLLEGDASC